MIDDLVARVWRDVGDQWAELRRVIGFWEPLGALPPWMAPAVALGALLALAVAGGIALASLGALLTSVLVAYLLLERVFGVSIALTPPR
ncbi:MAG: hypothetical protein ACRERC_24010 [Candidatus Binatia bacterium]